MAQLTRKFLRAMGVEEDKIDEIVNAHAETLEAIKQERDGLRDKAEQAAKVQADLDARTKERDSLQKRVEALEKAGGETAKVQAAFDAYKAQVEGEKTTRQKAEALDAVLKSAGVRLDSFRKMMLKSWDMDKVELDEKGGVKDAEALTESIKRDYGDFISKVEIEGVPTVTPPAGGKGGGSMSRAAQIAREYHDNLYGNGKETE